MLDYSRYGFKESRDPSASFDIELYLARNADVKAAGLDPLAHYLQCEQAEGRQAYAAIGKPSDFTHGSFGAEFYLLANTDVAKAALAVGGDAFAFAYQHLANYGWQEGRKADAFFDTAYYLAHSPGVAAAQINPLSHYDQYGWKEGRDPSAGFDTSAYLAPILTLRRLTSIRCSTTFSTVLWRGATSFEVQSKRAAGHATIGATCRVFRSSTDWNSPSIDACYSHAGTCGTLIRPYSENGTIGSRRACLPMDHREERHVRS